MSREETPDVGSDGDREPPLRDVLRAMHNMDSPGVTATDISVVLGCSVDVARRRLQTLAEKGRVASRATGQQTLWWDVEAEQHKEYGVVAGLEPVDMGDTNAVDLIEAGEDQE